MVAFVPDNSIVQRKATAISKKRFNVVQDLFNARLEYGFHEVFVLAALLDPALYPQVNSIPMEQRIQAEELVMKLMPTKAQADAAVAQLKNWREGKHNIPDWVFDNTALLCDPLGFWRDYGLQNPSLKYIAKVAVRVLGIPPTAAGVLQHRITYLE